MMDRCAIGLRVVLWGMAAWLICGIGNFAAAQRRVVLPGQSIDGVADASEKSSVLPVDREVSRALKKAQEAIAAEEYGDALYALDKIICGDKQQGEAEDYFYQPDEKNEGVFRSLKVEAQQIIANLPPKGRDLYEVGYGPEAKRLLASAVESGDIANLEKAVRNYPHTDAGREAALLLSQHYLDHGQPLSAALCLRRVENSPAGVDKLEPMLSISLASCWLRAGYADKAKETLVALKAKYPKGTIKLGEKSVAIFDKDAEAVNWLTTAVGQMRLPTAMELAQWVMFRGNAARNAISQGGSPVLNERWRVDTTMDEKAQKVIESQKKQQREQSAGVMLPSGHPLAVVARSTDKDGHPLPEKNFVLMRTPTCLLGIDFQTGKRVWRYPPETDSLQASVPDPANPQIQAQAAQLRMLQRQGLVLDNLSERLWDSATYGTLSSDGESVFLIDEAELGSIAQMPQMGRGRFMGQMTVPGGLQQNNKLVALELATEGKLRWAVGGPSGTDEPKLAGVYFLGPPLPLMGRLFVIGEANGVIQLYVLDGRSGRVEWMQQLAQITEQNQFNPLRRLTGASPSFADGVLVCPTSSNSVVAVDLATRTLLWGYQYNAGPNGPVYGNGWSADPFGAQGSGSHWADSCVTIADGKALIAPMESDELHCLSLVDGKFLWKMKRDEYVYVACVHKGNAILVGRKTVQAVKLADSAGGAPTFAWKGQPVPLPGGAAPSGRGFYSGNSYFLPLTSAAVMRIDLDAGKEKESFRSRKGYVPGNLICFKDNIISQGVDYLESFYQLEPLKARIETQLKQNPDDAEALTRRGEISFVDGKLAAALSDLRRAMRLNQQPETRDLLLETLLASLKEDFVGNRDSLAETERLIDLPSERATFLRIKAAGLMKAGEIAPALETYLTLTDLDLNRAELEAIDGNYSVRRDRWLQGQLTGLLTSAKSADLEKINVAVQSRLDAALQADTPDKKADLLRRFLSYFGAHPSSDTARDQLALLLTKRETVLEKESLLQALEKSTDPARHRSAVARLAQLLSDTGRPDDAAHYYLQLETRLANEICWQDKTGAQLVGELPKTSPVRKYLVAVAGGWPRGEVKPERGGAGARMNRNVGFPQFFPVELHGDCGPFYEDTSLHYDMQRFLVARDGLGQERFRVNLLDKQNPNQIQNQYGNIQGMVHASARGHLLVVNLGLSVLAIDTLRSEGGKNGGGDRILWKQDLVEQVNGQPLNRGINQMQVANPWGGPAKFQILDNATQQPFGGVGAVTAHGVIVQRNREVQCLDTMTGETLWARQNIAPGADVLGDDECVIVAPADGKNSLVLRTVDGALLDDKRDIPAREQRWTTLGRMVLTWENSNGKTKLALRDPWQKRDVWSRELSSESKGALVHNDEVALLERSGKFCVLDLATGAKRIEETLDPDASLNSLSGIRSRDQYLAVTSTLAGNNARAIEFDKKFYQAPLGEALSPLILGRVYAFDRATGKKQWSVAADVQRHGLLLNQPADLPVLVFARQSNDTARGGTSSGVLCLDKRTGRAAYQNDNIGQQFNNVFEIVGDREAHTVAMTYPGQTITLTFTDNPIPPEPPFQASLDLPEPEKGTKGLVNGLLRAIRGGQPEGSEGIDTFDR